MKPTTFCRRSRFGKQRAGKITGWKPLRKSSKKDGSSASLSRSPASVPTTSRQRLQSQAHNYFIHRLINERDLNTIGSAVSYIDRVTEESIPTLPTGTCIFSGIASQMPLKLTVRTLAVHEQPRSATRAFNDMVPPQ